MALTDDARKAMHKAAGETIDVMPYSAQVVAAMYAAFLNVNIPSNMKGITRFSPKQAFALTRHLMYDALKDSDVD